MSLYNRLVLSNLIPKLKQKSSYISFFYGRHKIEMKNLVTREAGIKKQIVF